MGIMGVRTVAAGGREWAFLAAALLLLGLFVPVVAGLPTDDYPPAVMAVSPSPAAADVALGAATDGSLTAEFSEPVALAAGAVELVCERSQVHALTTSGGPVIFAFASDRSFLPGEECVMTIHAEQVSDLDTDDPPDLMGIRYEWSFTTTGAPVVMNELDAISAADVGEFVELYDGGHGQTDLGGLTIVFYRGDEASVYLAVALDGLQTDAAGYFVLGDSGVVGADLLMADGTLRNGPDAVAVYAAPKSDFPRNAPVSTTNLLDAVVYGPADERLLVLLNAGQASLDEDARGTAASDSSQRCPNGGGQPRESVAFVQNNPSPGGNNHCQYDDPPQVTGVVPKPSATDVALDASLTVTFSEPVALIGQPFEISCTMTGVHAYDVNGGPETFTITLYDPLNYGETCSNTIWADMVHDVDTDDPPDTLAGKYNWTFQTVNWVAEHVVINEVDVDTPGVDAAEFIELFDGGEGNTPLDGLNVVLFNGTDDRSYLTINLDGKQTDNAGYFVLGNTGVDGVGIEFPKGALQNGPDAVALVVGELVDWPNGTPIAGVTPLDALVYGRSTQVDSGLLPLLNAGQPQVDEAGRGDIEAHSNQRCPNGAGGSRNTSGYKQNTPTPGVANNCITDKAPQVIGFLPARGAQGVSPSTTLVVNFDEPVKVTGKWITVKCTVSGTHTYKTTGGPIDFTATPDAPFAYGESCTVIINPDAVTDQDSDDPPDKMTGKISWSFTIGSEPADFVLINEVDSDTPGTDTAEFIELFDGGGGRTDLDGLVIVLYNGSNNLSYGAIDLDGFSTDEQGYFVLGDAAVIPDLVMANGFLQNGPDAAALYIGDAARFPGDSPVVLQGLLDAAVYGTPAAVSPDLLKLLEAGQEAADEGERGAADVHSLQRCPNGGGGQRWMDSYAPNTPTPGASNRCEVDAPPMIISTIPAVGVTDVSIYASINLTFNEAVDLAAGSIQLACGTQTNLSFTVSDGPLSFMISPAAPMPQETTCRLKVIATNVSDQDDDDPPDHMAGDYQLEFTTGRAGADFVLINEIDADTPGSDTAEFIELFDGGRGNTSLSGLVLVLFNGGDDRSYRVIDLVGLKTDSKGFATVGNKGVPGVGIELPGGFLQNGADAVALYAAGPDSFPNGTAVHTGGLIDALVYGTSDSVDAGLLALLEAGQLQIDEAGADAADQHSVGRCPNGEGGPRRTTTYRASLPTPGIANDCEIVEDTPPAIVSVTPADGEANAPLNSAIRLRFNEAVELSGGWYVIDCELSGLHAATVAGDSIEVVLQPNEAFSPGESCIVQIKADLVSDVDTDDPPDHMLQNFQSMFQTAPVVVQGYALINEIDADTPGSDTAEFIELYDGGDGYTSLNNLVMIWWNGGNDTIYRVIDLSDQTTNEDGFLVLGNEAVNPDVTFEHGALQNGPDAVALYTGNAADFGIGMPLTTVGLVDAVVYGSGVVDTGLLSLLEAGEPQLDEGSRGDREAHSLARCPDGAGGPRRTTGYAAAEPSPGRNNSCMPLDTPPAVVSISPLPDSVDVPLVASLIITFTEDVETDAGWLGLSCAAGGELALDVAGGPRVFVAVPRGPLPPGAHCTVTIHATAVHDTDADDPPDTLPEAYVWQFTTAADLSPPPVAGFVSNGPVWVGEWVVFINTSAGPGPLAYVWEFGDGGPSSGEIHPTHRYERMGTYTVMLTATGPSGTATYSASIDVRPRRLYLGVIVR